MPNKPLTLIREELSTIKDMIMLEQDKYDLLDKNNESPHIIEQTALRINSLKHRKTMFEAYIHLNVRRKIKRRPATEYPFPE